jgi:hypothetical protein
MLPVTAGVITPVLPALVQVPEKAMVVVPGNIMTVIVMVMAMEFPGPVQVMTITDMPAGLALVLTLRITAVEATECLSLFAALVMAAAVAMVPVTILAAVMDTAAAMAIF